MPMFNVSQ